MTAPAYTWSFDCDLWGDRVPKVMTLEAVTNLLVKEGNLVKLTSGQIDVATASDDSLFGIAAETVSVAATAGDPVRVYPIAEGMVIKGTADATAAALSGFNGKTVDITSAQLLDPDAASGCLSVWRTEDSGLTVYCVITEFDMGCKN